MHSTGAIVAKFPTPYIQRTWFDLLQKTFPGTDSIPHIACEYPWIRDTFPPTNSIKPSKDLPFIALNMAKCHKDKPASTDEFFIDEFNNPLDSRELLKSELKSLHIKNFNNESDVAKEYKQANTACSIADLYLLMDKVEVVIELEDFKDKPFSNLIYIPQACSVGSDRDRPLLFLHIFAPLRNDTAAELSKAVGKYLGNCPSISRLKYLSIDMPALPESIAYLLPSKTSKDKPKGFGAPADAAVFRRYLEEFALNEIVENIKKFIP